MIFPQNDQLSLGQTKLDENGIGQKEAKIQKSLLSFSLNVLEVGIMVGQKISKLVDSWRHKKL